jgi:hypothetical protein
LDSNPFSILISSFQDILKLHSNRVGTAIRAVLAEARRPAGGDENGRGGSGERDTGGVEGIFVVTYLPVADQRRLFIILSDHIPSSIPW